MRKNKLCVSIIRLLRLSSIVALSLWLFGCEKPVEQNESGKIDADYIETGDLDDIQARGVLRLLAVRSQYSGLPRNEIPAEIYYREAEAFAEFLALTPVWIYVDEYSQLIPMLNEGRGDIIVTNFTRTDERAEQVSFTRGLHVVDEILVHASDTQLDPEQDAFVVGVAPGTSYFETAQKLQQKNASITVKAISDEASDTIALGLIQRGEIDATIVDSNILELTLGEYPTLTAGEVLAQNRTLAWAVRKQSPVLHDRINQYLISHRILASSRSEQQRNWKTIKEQGVLRVITMNTPQTYFLWRGQIRGFDYELIKLFAQQHNLRLQMIVRNSLEEMMQALELGQGDVIAASLTRTERREQAGLAFTKRYLTVTEKLIGNQQAALIETLDALNDKAITVNPNSSFYETLQVVKEQVPNLHIISLPESTSEGLIERVANGEFDYTISDSHTAQLEKTWRGDSIWVGIDISAERDIAWAVRQNQNLLKQELNAFIEKEYRGLNYNILRKRYFEAEKSIARHYEHRIEPGKAISPYDDLVKKVATEFKTDWRLLLAQMYQESEFNPKARSFAGAVGLMQLLPRTAKSFGFSDLEDPETNIRASIAFKKWLEKRFPANLPLEEKTYFTLAAYNAGHGHVNEARKLARRLGKDPNQWFGHVEEAMLLLAQPQYYRQSRYGYVRGQEPVNYVRQIRERYLAYLRATGG